MPGGANSRKHDEGECENQMTGAGVTRPSTVFALAIDPKSPATLYATVFGGTFKSTDSGASWADVSLGLPTVNALAIDPEASNTVYAGTFGGGVFKSINGAGLWVPMNVGLPDMFIGALAIDPQAHLTIYAGTFFGAGGVFKSTDGGANWIPKFGPAFEFHTI